MKLMGLGSPPYLPCMAGFMAQLCPLSAYVKPSEPTYRAMCNASRNRVCSAQMLDADAAEFPDWSAGYGDVSFDETSDLLFGTTFACADEPFLLVPQPGPQQASGSSHDQPDSRTAPAAAATSLQSNPTPPRRGADAAGKAAGRLEKKAEQNRRAVFADIWRRGITDPCFFSSSRNWRRLRRASAVMLWHR